jgi:hypothetical protein
MEKNFGGDGSKIVHPRGKTCGKKNMPLESSPRDLIRFTGAGEGSTIWNLAWRNKKWVQDHSFWEIRNGQTTRFWEDAWQQEPRLENQDREGIKQELLRQGKVKVFQYWKQRDNIPKWRTWDAIQTQDINQNSPLVKDLEEELWKRNIMFSDEEDQLRWGRKDGGEFTLNEASILYSGS